MALFKRKDLEGKGLTADQIDYIMTESGRALAADYIPRSSLQDEVDKALKDHKPDVDLSTNEEYLKVVGERDMLRALGSEDYAGVKPKFREAVYKLIDRGEKAEPLKDQMAKIAKDYEEYFIPDEDPGKGAPRFGADVSGGMPKGTQKSTFESVWGFGKKGDN